MSKKHKDINDAQVLALLRVRKMRLKLEMDRVDMAIKAFENIKEIDPLDAAIYEVEEQEGPLITDELAESILMYNPKLTTEKKIEYALRHLISAEASQIAEFLIRVDGHIKGVYAFNNNITYTASRMYKLGKIGANKVGKRNVYFLFKPPVS
jgi:hypothetical protein